MHPDNPKVVKVPGALGKQIAVGTLSSIRRATGVERNAHEAVAAHVELLRSAGRPVPEPTTHHVGRNAV